MPILDHVRTKKPLPKQGLVEEDDACLVFGRTRRQGISKHWTERLRSGAWDSGVKRGSGALPLVAPPESGDV